MVRVPVSYSKSNYTVFGSSADVRIAGNYDLAFSFAEDGTPILSKAQKRATTSTTAEPDLSYT